MGRFEEAVALAARAHHGQRRKISGVPFITHPLRVAELLLMEDAPEDVVIAGLLHDVIEDTRFPREDLERFGEEVMRLVEFCTEPGNRVDVPDAVQRESWEERKRRTVEACASAGDDELLLELADKLANLESVREDLMLGLDVWSGFNAPQGRQEWYYRSLDAIFAKRLGATRLYRLYARALADVFG